VIDTASAAGSTVVPEASRKRKSREKKSGNKKSRLDMADADKLSPVSGTVILREAPSGGDKCDDGVTVSGDIDSSVNCVEVFRLFSNRFQNK